jgi:hypothetical protein
MNLLHIKFCNDVAFLQRKTKVRTLLSLEQSPFLVMTSYFFPDINVARTTLQDKIIWVALSYSASSFILFFLDLKIMGHENPDSNLE